MKQKHFIDFHKGITFIYILMLINFYSAFDNTTIWIYLGLHGTYGILWVLKSFIFPDKTWDQKTNFAYGLVILSGLSLYWISPWLIVSGYFNGGDMIVAPNWLISIVIFMFGLGVFLHFSSDMQKHTILKTNPGTLISDGLFKRSRNINYFGELSSEEIMNERKNKFLKIGRNDGFMSSTEDLSTLTIKKNNFDKVFKSKKVIIAVIGGLILITSILLLL